MENSFFEYRNETGSKSASDSDEVIDNSLTDSFTLQKQLAPPSAKKNHTVFVPESEGDSESDEFTGDGDDDDNDEYQPDESIKMKTPKNGRIKVRAVISSDEDENMSSNPGSIRRNREDFTKVVLSSSSDEEGEQASPELIPRRRPPTKQSITSSKSDSPLIRRVKRRMILTDSENDNSIVIENNKHKKQPCLKDTPLKIDNSVHNKENLKVIDMQGSNDDEVEDSSDEKEDKDKSDDGSEGESDEIVNSSDDGPDEAEMVMSKATRMSIMGVVPKDFTSDDSDFIASDENNIIKIAASQIRDELADSGILCASSENNAHDTTEEYSVNEITKNSNINSKDSITGSTSSLSELPDVGIHIIIQGTPQKVEEAIDDPDNSRISCSTFGSPAHDSTKEYDVTDLTKDIHNLTADVHDLTRDINIQKTSEVIHDLTNDHVVHDLTNVTESVTGANVRSVRSSVRDSKRSNGKSLTGASAFRKVSKEIVYDEDVTIIDTKPEIIALSSDDEDELTSEKKSPRARKSPSITKSESVKKTPSPRASKSPRNPSNSSKNKENTMSKYLLPESYPNQVVYVKKHVRENELGKLNSLQEDLHNIRNLLDNMDVETLPDRGEKLVERLSRLEGEVRRQGDKVASMLVEPDNPSAAEMGRDGFDKQGLSWDDIQKVSNQVQPRMFGKQAMATHMAERSAILDRLRDLHSAIEGIPPESSLATPPKDMKSELMPHQRYALSWLLWREGQRPSGGILADDMGLGKTITMISLVLAHKERNLDDEDGGDDDDDEWQGKNKTGRVYRGGTLVVCPATLLQQWGGEVSKHCRAQALSVSLHHGAARAAQPHRLTGYDIVVTTYNILQRDHEKNGVLFKINWSRVILDEAHIVRNHKSATSRAVSGLRARRRWCLTGTPVHNKDLDVFALLKFLRCQPFDDLAMWKKWIDNKSLGGQERLSTIMRGLLLRRTKVQLQAQGSLPALPTRTQVEVPVTLRKEEMNVYQKVLVFSKTLFAQFLHQRAEKQSEQAGLLPRPSGKDDPYAQMHKKMVALHGAKPVKSHEILVLLLRLRQVCCHCGLIASMLSEGGEGEGVAREDEGGLDLLLELNKLSLESKEPVEEDIVPEESTTVAEALRSVMSPDNPVFQLSRRSAKIQAVIDTMQKHVLSNREDKAVIVSQWTSVLRLVEKELRDVNVRCVTLSGNVPVTQRQPLVDAINDPDSSVRVMLLSLCAGGVGLNLCGARHLLLLDPHWNPQLELQAQDRVYRLGQTRPVHVYRFMCVDTVEQSIRRLQDSKLAMAEAVLTGARENVSKLSIEDLKMLFNMGPS